MGEDVTKLQQNIKNIKKVINGGKDSDTEKEGSTDKPEGSKKE